MTTSVHQHIARTWVADQFTLEFVGYERMYVQLEALYLRCFTTTINLRADCPSSRNLKSIRVCFLACLSQWATLRRSVFWWPTNSRKCIYSRSGSYSVRASLRLNYRRLASTGWKSLHRSRRIGLVTAITVPKIKIYGSHLYVALTPKLTPQLPVLPPSSTCCMYVCTYLNVCIWIHVL